MGKIVFILIAFIIALQVWRQNGVKKLYWYFAGLLFFPQTIILFDKPYMPFPRFMAFTLLFTMLFQSKNWKPAFKKFPLKIAIVILFISLMLIGLLDERVNLFLKIYRPFTYFIESFFVLYMTYFFTKSVSDAHKLYRFVVKCLLVFCIYGVINFVVKQSFYTALIADVYNSVDLGNTYNVAGSERFRITSFAWHPIYYGFLLCIAIIIITHLLYDDTKSGKLLLYLSLALAAVNLLWTNSRTPLLSLFAGLAVFFVWGLNLKRKIRIAFAVLSLFLIAVFVFPNSFGIISESVNTFTSKGSKLEGSSVEMRQMQMAASLALFAQQPVAGHGISYIFEDLGFAVDKDKRNSNEDFAGFESYSYKLLIEQGLLGIISNLIFFITLVIYFFRNGNKANRYGHSLAFISVSIIVTFLLFIFGTGDLGTFAVCMSLLGVNIKVVALSLKPVTYRHNQDINISPLAA